VYLDGDRLPNDFDPGGFVSPSNSREGFQLVADAAGHQSSAPFRDLSSSDWKAGSKRTSDGYVVEFEIPLAMIDVEDGPRTVPAGPGELIGFGVAIVDNDSNVSDQTSYAYLRARPDVDRPMRGEQMWSMGLKLGPRAIVGSPTRRTPGSTTLVRRPPA
jgi:hypothetical protein